MTKLLILTLLPAALFAGDIKVNALALAKRRAIKTGETNAVIRMADAPRISASEIRDGVVIHRMSDGSEVRASLKVAHTARVTAGRIEVEEPKGKSASFMLGFAAGVAACGGVVVARKSVRT